MAAGALIAISVAAFAFAAAKPNQPGKVKVGNLELTFNGGFAPKALPKKTFAPISLTAEGKIRTTDGTHPPAMKEVIVETDKNGAIDVKGYPTCTSGALQSRDTKSAEGACKKAIIGEGTTTAEVEFAEQAPISVDSKLLVVNGGKKGGTTTLFIHAYFSAPVSGAIVTTLKISSVKNGRYGTKTIATIPKIAGGFGSVTDFRLKIDKKFTYQGKQKSILTARCADGKLQAHATAVFSDGTRASTEILRTCTSKG